MFTAWPGASSGYRSSYVLIGQLVFDLGVAGRVRNLSGDFVGARGGRIILLVADVGAFRGAEAEPRRGALRVVRAVVSAGAWLALLLFGVGAVVARLFAEGEFL